MEEVRSCEEHLGEKLKERKEERKEEKTPVHCSAGETEVSEWMEIET